MASFGQWLLRNPAIVALAVLALHVAAHQFIIDPRLRAQRDTALAERDAEIAAHITTKADYRAAQQHAAQLEADRLARVKAEQQEITDEVEQSYKARLADARARAEQLREQLARAGEHPAGAAGGEHLPGPGAAPGRAVEAPGDYGLSLYERLIATEQAIQLDALIEWVERQASVQVNP